VARMPFSNWNFMFEINPAEIYQDLQVNN
jgi:hypothetical protein